MFVLMFPHLYQQCLISVFTPWQSFSVVFDVLSTVVQNISILYESFPSSRHFLALYKSSPHASNGTVDGFVLTCAKYLSANFICSTPAPCMDSPVVCVFRWTMGAVGSCCGRGVTRCRGGGAASWRAPATSRRSSRWGEGETDGDGGGWWWGGKETFFPSYLLSSYDAHICTISRKPPSSMYYVLLLCIEKIYCVVLMWHHTWSHRTVSAFVVIDILMAEALPGADMCTHSLLNEKVVTYC